MRKRRMRRCAALKPNHAPQTGAGARIVRLEFSGRRPSGPACAQGAPRAQCAAMARHREVFHSPGAIAIGVLGAVFVRAPIFSPALLTSRGLCAAAPGMGRAAFAPTHTLPGTLFQHRDNAGAGLLPTAFHAPLRRFALVELAKCSHAKRREEYAAGFEVWDRFFYCRSIHS